MEKDQAELRRVGIAEDEILHHLVDKYHPSNIELRRTRHPLGEFLTHPENERLLLSEVWYREEKRLFNRTQRLNQEIATVKTPWKTVDGKKNRVVWILHLVAGKLTNDALARVRHIIEGNEEKEKRLLDKRRRERHFREVARRLEQSIERRRRGRRP